MASSNTNFKVTDTAVGFTEADFNNLFVRKDCFLEGGLWFWGQGGSGRLGNNCFTNQSSPVQTVSGGTNWRSVSLGNAFSAAIKTDGSLWMWGSGGSGKLGTNATANRSSPVQTISGGCDWHSVDLGVNHSAAIKTDGSLWLWGSGNCGLLGDNCTVNRSSPVQTVSGGCNWRSVSIGQYHSAAIKTDGSLWLWGENFRGQLGNNSTSDRSSPVQTISGGTNWRTVSVGFRFSAAIKTDGSLWLWGSNTYGKLGTNNVTCYSSPVQTVSGGNNWHSVNLGFSHSAGIKTDGSLWLWGSGNSGRLGNNCTINRSSPVQTVSGGCDWRVIGLGTSHSSAIKTDGSLWLWGIGSCGRLGNNSTAYQSSPVQTVSGGTNWRSISLDNHSAAIREGCW